MSNSIPRGRRVESNSAQTTTERKSFNGQICGKCILTAEEVKVIKDRKESVPTAFREAVAGDVIVMAVSDNYDLPRLRVDNTFKDNPVFNATPKFDLLDVLENTSEDGSVNKDTAAFAASLREKYLTARKESKTATIAALKALRNK